MEWSLQDVWALVSGILNWRKFACAPVALDLSSTITPLKICRDGLNMTIPILHRLSFFSISNPRYFVLTVYMMRIR